MSCLKAIDNFIWKNLDELTEFEHCKPAPFISHYILMVIRVTISLGLLAFSIAIFIISDWGSIKYFSEWAVYAATVCYGLMAYVQIKTQKKVEDFALDVEKYRRDSWIQDDLENEVNTSNLLISTGWKWIIFFYQMCLTSCLLASAVFWITYAVDWSNDPNFES
jgi:hypothetical protein